MAVLIRQHLLKCFAAGIVAILPIAGLVVTFAYFESQVAGTWLKNQGFYFFGLGLLIVVVLIYLLGLAISNFIGRWVWHRFDHVLERLPILGSLYQTLKQILGYGEGPGGFFKRVVMVPMGTADRWELGLVTREADQATDDRLAVFVPSAPAPTAGRLVFVRPQDTQAVDISVNDALKMLVSIGALELNRPWIPKSSQTEVAKQT